MRTRSRAGFTLLELMIVVSIIAILATIAVPRLAGAFQRAHAGSIKGSLGSLRSALSIYYADMEGQYPTDLATLTVSGRYLRALPKVKGLEGHPESVAIANLTAPNDAGGWLYNNLTSDSNFGTVSINCTHTDATNRYWSTY